MAHMCVTGASRGIGLGFVRAYLSKKDTVFAAVRNPDADGIRALKAEYPDTLIPIQMDVSDRDSVHTACQEIAGHTESLDILINNAGIAKEPNEQRIEDIREEDVSEVFNTNTLGPLRVTQKLFPLLHKASDPRVVMISSSAGSIAGQGGGRGVPYCVSKAALNMLTKLLYFHCTAEGVATAAIHPGWVHTDMGGKGALSVEESVSQMMQQIERMSSDGPIYIDYKGDPMQW